mgnify:FL=1
MKDEGIPLDKVCLLDPRAPAEIAPKDGSDYSWFLCVPSPLAAELPLMR